MTETRGFSQNSDGPPFGDPRLPPRFWDKVSINSETGCWEWSGSTGKGYGATWWDGRLVGAHRVSYMQLIAAIPEDLQIDHLCRVRHCVNPAQLEPVSQQENISRGDSWRIFGARTHCSRGHKYTQDNTVIRKGNTRTCRKCSKMADLQQAISRSTVTRAKADKRIEDLSKQRDALLKREDQ